MNEQAIPGQQKQQIDIEKIIGTASTMKDRSFSMLQQIIDLLLSEIKGLNSKIEELEKKVTVESKS